MLKHDVVHMGKNLESMRVRPEELDNLADEIATCEVEQYADIIIEREGRQTLIDDLGAVTEEEAAEALEILRDWDRKASV